MSQNQRASDHVLPSCFDPKSFETPTGQTVIKTELVAHSVDPKEADVYWMVKCGQEILLTVSWLPPKLSNDRVDGCTSHSHPLYLKVIRRFCRIPDSVEF
ncbi:hypothetical protein F2Q68_00039582 [Brassica cretica]|uniref:Uncharacterized protein n=1 Tax=Brassica cretica TaxID=69181 RepID=A0A8S9MC76_BRACR|nr:hypothetical protein F2Q68_00039582 [Brassica cretica]